MADNRLTKKRLKNHFAYNWWKYALSAAVSAMLVSIVFAVTAYRPPAEKKVELYVLNGTSTRRPFSGISGRNCRRESPNRRS